MLEGILIAEFLLLALLIVFNPTKRNENKIVIESIKDMRLNHYLFSEAVLKFAADVISHPEMYIITSHCIQQAGPKDHLEWWISNGKQFQHFYTSGNSKIETTDLDNLLTTNDLELMWVVYNQLKNN